MKLRIKSNSIRIRLTKSEVCQLANTGYLEEQTSFGENAFVYALQSVDAGKMSASFNTNKITVFIPAAFIKGWDENDTVGFRGTMTTGNNNLDLLVEKDFICLDETTEDQSDNYENPKINC